MSWDVVISEVRRARRELGAPETVWYRGHWSSSYTLMPSLLRIAGGMAKEQVLFHKYRQAASHLMKARETDWETLFDMQHYGIPTRLLDWSETFGVAVFFALGTQASEAALYVLDPVRLNRVAAGTAQVKRADDPGFSYRSVYWNKIPIAPRLPIALEPPFQNDRMFAQRGMFTIHGDDERSLEEQCPDALRKIVIPESARQGALEFLEFASLNELSIFPDIVGIASHIRNQILSIQSEAVRSESSD
jgi:hypothetical protein